MIKRGPKAAYNFRHQIVTVVGDDVAEWLKRRQGEGESYRSLSAVTREVLEAARRLEQITGELVNELSDNVD